MTKTDQNIPPTKGDIFVAGDSIQIRDTIVDGNGDPVDISGQTAEFALARYRGGETVVTKDTSDGISITDGPNGELTVELDPSDTAGLGDSDGETYEYEIEVTVGGTVATVTTGTFTIVSDIA